MIDFTLTSSQRKIQSAAKNFAGDVLRTAHETYDSHPSQRARFQSIRPLYTRAVQAGHLLAAIPKPLGGISESLIDAAIAMEEQYAVDASVTLTVAGTLLGLMPLFFGGNERQFEKFLKPFLDGRQEPLASLVHSEPEGTANWLEKGANGLQTTAKLVGAKGEEMWVVNGRKLWTTNSGGWDGRGADLQCLVCRIVNGDDTTQDSNADPRDEVIIFLVDRQLVAQNESSAYQILQDPEVMGHKACSGPLSQWTNFKVPASEERIHIPARGPAAVAVVE